MKQFLSVAAAVLVLGACADSPTGPIDSPHFNNGVASPGTALVITFTIPGDGAGHWAGAGVNPASAPNGSCVEVNGEPGHFKNPAGHVSPNQNAGQCWVSTGGSAPQVISFTALANYVQAKSGNQQLNFGSVCDPEDPDACSDTWIHYKANSNTSTGKGVIFGGGYTVDLGTIDMPGNVLANRPVAVTVCAAGGAPCYGGEINW